MLYQISETIKAALYPVLGNLAYEMGLTRLLAIILLPPALLIGFFMYRAIRRTLLKSAQIRESRLEDIAEGIAEIQRLLRILVTERDGAVSDSTPKQ